MASTFQRKSVTRFFSVDIFEALGAEECKLVRPYADNRAVLLVKSEHMVMIATADDTKLGWYSRNGPQFWAGKFR